MHASMTSSDPAPGAPLCFGTLSRLAAHARWLCDPVAQRAEAARFREAARTACASDVPRLTAAAAACDDRVLHIAAGTIDAEVRSFVEADSGPAYWPTIERVVASTR